MHGKRRADRLNLDWLTGCLAVGGTFPQSAIERLDRDHRITHVVDVRGEACDEELALARRGIRFLHLPSDEARALTPTELAEGVAWVRRALVPGRRAFIHSQQGTGRGPLLALCVLVDGGMAPLEAMEIAKEARTAISPSPEQLRALLAFAGEARVARKASWLIPSFEALAAVAYRHARPVNDVGVGRPGPWAARPEAPAAPAVDDVP